MFDCYKVWSTLKHQGTDRANTRYLQIFNFRGFNISEIKYVHKSGGGFEDLRRFSGTRISAISRLGSRR